MRRRTLLSMLAVFALGGLLAIPLAFAGGSSSCPGTIICPVTGDEVCKDRCPLGEVARDDCPGVIECPLTGEPVCRDRCPVGADAGQSCCRGAK